MNKYSTKIIKKQFNDQLIKAVKLSPLTASLETMKLARCLMPSFGALTDAVFSQDRSLVFATALNLVAMNSTAEYFEQLQVLILGSILNSEDEPLEDPEKINAWLENHPELNIFDLLVFLFSENLLAPLLGSDLFKGNRDKLNTVKNLFNGLFAELPNVEGVDDEPEEATTGV